MKISRKSMLCSLNLSNSYFVKIMKQAGRIQKGNIVDPGDILVMIDFLKSKNDTRSLVFAERVEKYYNLVMKVAS